MTGESPVASATDTVPELVFVPAATLFGTTPLAIDLYLPGVGASPAVLFRARNVAMTRDDVQRLREQGVRLLGVPAAAYTEYQRYLRANLQGVLADTGRPAAERIQYLGEVARDSLRSACESNRADKLVAEAGVIGERLVELACEPTLVAYDLYSMLRHDVCTFSHSYNVAAYAVLLARKLGWNDEPLLRRLSIAALLHDVGKLHIPATILGRAGPLSDDERALVRRHPQRGYERLANRRDIDWEQLMVVYQHHEQPDGNGYPVGNVGSEIHPWARLCAVVNRFESRTSARPYRAAVSAAAALEDLAARAGSALDPEFTQCWRALWPH